LITKVCSGCLKRKHRNKFPRRATADGHYSRCYVCYNKQKAEWRAKNPGKNQAAKQKYRSADPDRLRDNNLRSKYGISLADYNQMLAEQDGVCAICSLPERVKHGKSGKTAPLAVDHCHDTGRVRGLLCFSCNVALGKFNDDHTLVNKALNYLLTSSTPLR
jgi:hypothetical protein